MDKLDINKIREETSSFPNPGLGMKGSRSPGFENQLHRVRLLSI
ncbi:MAG: hypothetical protein ACUZ8H_06450 [Candidatus Anammoxibacter sp.]